MNELLSDIVRAHGGFSRWHALDRAEATIVTGGNLWAMKGLLQDPGPRRMCVELHQQCAWLKPFGDPDWHTEFTPDRIAIVRNDGKIVAERDNPRVAFAGHDIDTAWDALHRAYFNGYALWLYLTTPFLLAREGIKVYEIEPWVEKDETWSVLRAEFSDAIATHSPVQDFFFGDDLLLRRHDYAVDVAGGFAATQLVHDYIIADGIRLPSKRRAYLRRPDGSPDLGSLMVSIDISNVRFAG
jgi:hypothetical protein